MTITVSEEAYAVFLTLYNQESNELRYQDSRYNTLSEYIHANPDASDEEQKVFLNRNMNGTLKFAKELLQAGLLEPVGDIDANDLTLIPNELFKDFRP